MLIAYRFCYDCGEALQTIRNVRRDSSYDIKQTPALAAELTNLIQRSCKFYPSTQWPVSGPSLATLDITNLDCGVKYSPSVALSTA